MNTGFTTIRRHKWIASALAALLLLTSAAAALAGEAGKDALTFQDALAIALEDAGFAQEEIFLTGLKLDYDDGRREFEVDFIAGDVEYEYELDAGSGTILKTSTERIDGRKKNIDPGAYLGFEGALDAALADAGLTLDEITLIEIQFDFDDGRAEYEVEFLAGGAEYQYELDAVSAQVLEREIERR